MYEKGPNLVPNDKGELVMEYTLQKILKEKWLQKNIEWHKENGTYTASYIIEQLLLLLVFLL